MEILTALLETESIEEVCLSSGYLNLHSKVVELLGKLECPVNVYTSSPAANSFYKGGKIKKHIPYMYRQFLADAANKMSSAVFNEFNREGWTFHSKGLWLREEGKIKVATIGSSNFSMVLTRLPQF